MERWAVGHKRSRMEQHTILLVVDNVTDCLTPRGSNRKELEKEREEVLLDNISWKFHSKRGVGLGFNRSWSGVHLKVGCKMGCNRVLEANAPGPSDAGPGVFTSRSMSNLQVEFRE